MNHELANVLLASFAAELETVRITWQNEMEKEREKEAQTSSDGAEVEAEVVTS
jgi:hypothetical protein